MIIKKRTGEEPTYKIVDKDEYYIPCLKWYKLINPYSIIARMFRLLGNSFFRALVYISNINYPKSA